MRRWSCSVKKVRVYIAVESRDCAVPFIRFELFHSHTLLIHLALLVRVREIPQVNPPSRRNWGA
jgi:hypothetical protein